ncbi:MAG: hypothetical protein CM15mP49_24840 [Actinomycetota bacterium]|nr:MAG: hypothetical protein CM15mP49_24840 [Actinomycetota bacterium]
MLTPRSVASYPRASAYPADEFVNGALKPFGPYEDAMLGKEWKLAHSVLSSSLNIGLLHPMEVVRAVEQAYKTGGSH